MGEADPVGVTQQKKNTHEHQLFCLPPSHTLTHTHTSLLSPPSGVCERGRVCLTYLCWTFNPFSTLSSQWEPHSSSPRLISLWEDNMTDAATNMRLKLPITCFILEIILIILFGTLVQYDHETDAKQWHNQSHEDYENDFYFRYPSECQRFQRGSGVRMHWLLICSLLRWSIGGFLSHASITMLVLVKKKIFDCFCRLLSCFTGEKRSWQQSPWWCSASIFFRTCSECQD